MTSIPLFLKSVGLTDKEASIYISLLELGPQAASVIARKVKLPRSSTFFQLDSLAEKGFVKKDIKASVQYFSAISPEDLKNVLKRNQQRVANQLEALEGLIPELNNLRSAFLPESKVSYFEGVEGICKMIDLQIETEEPMYFISAHRLHPEIRRYIREHFAPGRKGKKHKSQLIIANHEDARDYVEKYEKDVSEWVGFVEADKAGFESTIVIYGDVIHLISTQEQDLVGIMIENTYLAKTMKSVFDVMKHALTTKQFLGNFLKL